MIKVVLGYLMNKANRDIPFLMKEEFYKIKQSLLKKYGTLVGHDIQHIKKECYSCDGTGTYRCDYKMPEKCWSCYGDGVYQEFWTLLEKWQLGNHCFHNPIDKFYKKPDIKHDLIEGYIEHKKPKYRIGIECAMLLFLIYDRKNFKKMIGCGYYYRVFTPLLLINNAIFVIKNFDIKKYFPKKQIKYTSDELPF